MMVKRLVLLALALNLLACVEPKARKVVLISMYYPNHDYQDWLGEADRSLRFYQAYGMAWDSLEIILKKADAIILTGGKDIEPIAFGKDSLKHLCGATDPYRDSLEFALVDHAFDQDIPLFGGCRGMQVINVSKGGSLIIDLPSMRHTSIHQQDAGDAEHHLVDAGLTRWLQADIPSNAVVNSNHHQAIDVLADGFEILAYAEDSVIEAMIWEDTTLGPEIFCWQWHPERMKRSEPYAVALRHRILNVIQRNSEKP